MGYQFLFLQFSRFLNLRILIFEVFKKVLRLDLLLLLEHDLVLDFLHTLLLLGSNWLLEFGNFVKVRNRTCAVCGSRFNHHTVLVESDHSKIAIGIRSCANFLKEARLHHFRIWPSSSLPLLVLLTVKDVYYFAIFFVTDIAFRELEIQVALSFRLLFFFLAFKHIKCFAYCSHHRILSWCVAIRSCVLGFLVRLSRRWASVWYHDS